MKILLSFFYGILFLLFLVGCAHEISVERVSPEQRVNYGAYSSSADSMLPATRNLLGNFMLMDDFQQQPELLITKLEQLFLAESRPEYLIAMADAAYRIARRFQSEPDRAQPFYLASCAYAYGYLVAVDRPDRTPYDPGRLIMMRLYNVSAAEVFDYLRNRQMHLRSGFRLSMAGNHTIRFLPPQNKMPMPMEDFRNWDLCANFRTVNLTHFSHRSGIGVPLLAELKQARTIRQFAPDQSLPATLLLKFGRIHGEKMVSARFVICDSRNSDGEKVGGNIIPLEQDFSTPLAYMLRQALPFGYLQYMLFPEKTMAMQGLYKFEAFSEKRIPVLFVHGLMSNSRTWTQMINTLQNDPDLRKYYQFWGFSYSSGNPILFSAKMLRDALSSEREKITEQKLDPKMFDRMVIVGHSMGGLISKTLIMNSGDQMEKAVLPDFSSQMLLSLPEAEQKSVRNHLEFSYLPFVKRVVFIAVPHRGSLLSRAWYGRLGASMIHLSSQMLDRMNHVTALFRQGKTETPWLSSHLTGIDNLDPENPVLQTLDRLPFQAGIPYHSIIGNRKKSGVPGGTDGVVPYVSSHLDGAVSELVVKSGHSAQQNPLAIQELRRILLEHLRSYPDISIPSPEIRQVELLK